MLKLWQALTKIDNIVNRDNKEYSSKLGHIIEREREDSRVSNDLDVIAFRSTKCPDHREPVGILHKALKSGNLTPLIQNPQSPFRMEKAQAAFWHTVLLRPHRGTLAVCDWGYNVICSNEQVLFDQNELEVFLATLGNTGDAGAALAGTTVGSMSSERGSKTKKRGKRPDVTERVKKAMRSSITSVNEDKKAEAIKYLKYMKEEAMASTYNASRDTCRKARDAVLSKFVEN